MRRLFGAATTPYQPNDRRYRGGGGGGGGRSHRSHHSQQQQEQQQQRSHRHRSHHSRGRNSSSSGATRHSSLPKTQTSVFARHWRLWRNCCCRFGIYPLAVAPILTAAFLLSLYSSAGCSFVDLEIGFSPNSNAWNESQAMLGFFFYSANTLSADGNNDPVSFLQRPSDGSTTSSSLSHGNPVREALHNGCFAYTKEFSDSFITLDRTWKVARIMATIAGFSSLLCCCLIWLMVLTPLPTGSIWPCCLLPMVMLSFISEGSKFLLFDMALCSSSIWFPSGVDSLPQTAKSCRMGTSSIHAVVAGSLFLAALILICFKTPEARVLDPNYGLPLGHDVDLETEHTTRPNPMAASNVGGEAPIAILVDSDLVHQHHAAQAHAQSLAVDDHDLSTEMDDDIYTQDPTSAITMSSHADTSFSQPRISSDETSSVPISTGHFSTTSTPPPIPMSSHHSTTSTSTTSGGTPVMMTTIKANGGSSGSGGSGSHYHHRHRKHHSASSAVTSSNIRNASIDDDSQPRAPPRPPRSGYSTTSAAPTITNNSLPSSDGGGMSVDQRVSGSRISKFQQLQVNAGMGSDSLINQLVNDLDESFQDDHSIASQQLTQHRRGASYDSDHALGSYASIDDGSLSAGGTGSHRYENHHHYHNQRFHTIGPSHAAREGRPARRYM